MNWPRMNQWIAITASLFCSRPSKWPNNVQRTLHPTTVQTRGSDWKGASNTCDTGSNQRSSVRNHMFIMFGCPKRLCACVPGPLFTNRFTSPTQNVVGGCGVWFSAKILGKQQDAPPSAWWTCLEAERSSPFSTRNWRRSEHIGKAPQSNPDQQHVWNTLK